MKHITLILGTMLVLVLTACGHNAVTFGKGIGFDAGFDPEHLSARVELIYGEMVNVAARDNLEIELTSDLEGGDNQANAVAKTGTLFRVRIGQQIAGYTVEAIEAGASARDLVRQFPGESAGPVQAEENQQAPQGDGE